MHTQKYYQKRYQALSYLTTRPGAGPRLRQEMIQCKLGMAAHTSSLRPPAGGGGHSATRAKEEKLRRQVYATGDAVAILEAGAKGGGLGLAERRHVHQILSSLDVDAAHEWLKTVGFVNSEEMLSAEATGSFLRWYSSRNPHPTTPNTRAATTGAGAAASNADLAGVPGLDVEVCGPGIARYRMQQPDKLGTWARLGDQALAEGRARISTPRH